MASRSPNFRSQWGRKRRALERTGAARFRVITGGSSLERDLDAFFSVEGSGWKARNATAILSDPSAERLYRTFAREAAGRGFLRLYLLEVDGEVVAGDLGCSFGGVGFLLKTGFAESHSRLSPGLVLRGEALRASIEEGLVGYDFLGGPDAYKLRWTDQLRPRERLTAYGGRSGQLAQIGWAAVARPALVRGRRYVHAHSTIRRRLADAHRATTSARRSFPWSR